MFPTIEEAEKELQIAGELNPGPWIKHSINVGIAARNIAKKVSALDEDKAYILGILHDIGRRVGIVNIPKHVYEGYKFCSEKGWDEAAKICMTHSYVLMQDEFEYEPSTKEEIEIKDEFEKVMGCSVYDVLPDIGRTTLLSPPPWKPPVK